MKNLVLTIAAVVIAVLIFVLYPFEPKSTPVKTAEQVAESAEREALKSVPDKKVSLSFQGKISRDSQGKAEEKELTGKVTLTLKAWDHFLLKQKAGMTKYEVSGESFSLKAQEGSQPLELSKNSKLTMEIIDGQGQSKDDYFLLQLSDLSTTSEPQSLTTIRLQLHDKSGMALKSGDIPSKIQLEQWNSNSLTLDRSFNDRRTGLSTKREKTVQGKSRDLVTGRGQQKNLALFGQVKDLVFSTQ